jgi:hypothetical protein
MDCMQKFIFAVGRHVAVALMPVALLMGTRADAQPAQFAEPEPSRTELLAKVRWLQNRVQVLDARIQELEQPAQTAIPKPSKDYIPLVTVPPPPLITAANCKPPYTVDSQGLRHFIPECLSTTSPAPCDQPFLIDSSGIKHVKLACLNP